jgi:hypothetical protein
MNGGRVLLMTLSQRTSAKGTEYLSGWLGKARVVAFRSKEPDKYGNPQWDLFVGEPAPKDDGDQRPPLPARGARTWNRARQAGEAVVEDARQRYRPDDPPDVSEAALRDLRDGPGWQDRER